MKRNVWELHFEEFVKTNKRKLLDIQITYLSRNNAQTVTVT